MKNFIPLLFVFLLFAWSCGNKQAKTETPAETENSVEKAGDTTPGKAKDCDEYVDQYEKWMDNYLVLIEKFHKNPTDQEVLQQFLKIQTEALEWANQWQSEMMLCAGNETYEKRFNEISERAEKKLNELGIE